MTSKVDQYRGDLEEMKKLLQSSSRPYVKDLLLTGIRDLESEIFKLSGESSRRTSSNTTESATAKTTSSVNKCYDVRITNYAWDQSDKFVKLFVTLKNIQNLDKEQISCKFDSNSVEFCARALDNKNHIFTIKCLLHSIDPSSSYWKVKTDSLVIFLAKERQGSKWSHLTASEVKPKPDLSTDEDAMSDPSAGLMNMIKKMYDDGDDETKRTIAKAWTESRDKQKMDLDF